MLSAPPAVGYNGAMEQESQKSTIPNGRRNMARWLLVGAIVLVAGVLVAKWVAMGPSAGEQPLTGDLTVYVRPPGAKQDTYRIGEVGALPVRSGQSMSVEVQYNRPAHTYLIWLGPDGTVVPLYPWNMDMIEDKTLTSPPPKCRPTRFLLSPMTIGGGWPFGQASGLETVLLLARREPLGTDVNLIDLLSGFPASKLRHREEASAFAWDRGSERITDSLAMNRGPDTEAKKVDEAFLAFLTKLQVHFDLIRAVRFAHDGEK